MKKCDDKYILFNLATDIKNIFVLQVTIVHCGETQFLMSKCKLIDKDEGALKRYKIADEPKAVRSYLAVMSDSVTKTTPLSTQPCFTEKAC